MAEPRLRVLVRKLENFKGELPRYETSGASGMDIRAQLDRDLIIKPGERALIPTGLAFEISRGCEMQVRPRSGWAMREGVGMVNSPGTVDSDYRGEVKVILINWGDKPVLVRDQERVAQIVFMPVIRAELEAVETLAESNRGGGGFGSTGR